MVDASTADAADIFADTLDDSAADDAAAPPDAGRFRGTFSAHDLNCITRYRAETATLDWISRRVLCIWLAMVIR